MVYIDRNQQKAWDAPDVAGGAHEQMLQLKSNGFWSASFFRKAESSYED
jgi:hypothetical protein